MAAEKLRDEQMARTMVDISKNVGVLDSERLDAMVDRLTTKDLNKRERRAQSRISSVHQSLDEPRTLKYILPKSEEMATKARKRNLRDIFHVLCMSVEYNRHRLNNTTVPERENFDARVDVNEAVLKVVNPHSIGDPSKFSSSFSYKNSSSSSKKSSFSQSAHTIDTIDQSYMYSSAYPREQVLHSQMALPNLLQPKELARALTIALTGAPETLTVSEFVDLMEKLVASNKSLQLTSILAAKPTRDLGPSSEERKVRMLTGTPNVAVSAKVSEKYRERRRKFGAGSQFVREEDVPDALRECTFKPIIHSKDTFSAFQRRQQQQQQRQKQQQ